MQNSLKSLFPNAPVSRRFAAGGFAAVLVLSLAGCGTLRQKADAVQITASDHEVASCDRLGPVVLGTFDSEFDLRQRDLRFETARKGGNVLLVDSFAMATGGTAYQCGAIDPRRVAS